MRPLAAESRTHCARQRPDAYHGVLSAACYPEAVNRLYDLDPGADAPEIVRMIVEIPQHSANKYEYDGNLGVFRLDRALYSPLHYPGDYGFIPGPSPTTMTLLTY